MFLCLFSLVGKGRVVFLQFWQFVIMASKVDNNAVLDEPQAKKAKLENGSQSEVKTIHGDIKDLSKFTLDKIISNNTKGKTICLQGTFEEHEGTGLVILEKTAFEDEHFRNRSFFTPDSELKKKFHNDIYGNYDFLPKIELNTLKTTIIHPATEKHIQKYSIHNSYVIEETPDVYNNIVLPHITAEQFNLQWVYNILEHKSEAERIVFEDKDPEIGFVLVPDLKWNNESIETLYLLAITQARDIKSLRDLTAKHLPLLKNIKEKSEKVIEEKFGLDGSQLRIYLHYHPSFYHLHVHVSYLRHEGPGILAERAHMLTTVISNIELVPDYYQRATLPFIVRENDSLFKKLENKAIVKSQKSQNQQHKDVKC